MDDREKMNLRVCPMFWKLAVVLLVQGKKHVF